MHALRTAFISNLALLTEIFSGTKFWTLYKKALALYKSQPDKIEYYQSIKLCELLNHAERNTAEWRGLTKASPDNIKSIFPKIKLSNKQTYTSGFPDKVTANNNKSDWQYLSSSGTTGRMTVVVDFKKRDCLRAAELLNIKLTSGSPAGLPSVDIPPSACNVVCGMKDAGPEPFFTFLFWSLKTHKIRKPDFLPNLRGRFERQYLFNREVLNPIDAAEWSEMSMQLDDYIDQITSKKIQVIRALPHFLLWLAIRAKQKNITFTHVKKLIPYGGLAGDNLVKIITEVFTASYINLYGTGEVGSIGCSSDKDTVINLYDSMVVVEILNQFDQPVAVGEVGRVVVTDLNNHAMPIIRYDIEDVAELIEVNPLSAKPSKIKIHGRRKEAYVSSSDKMVTPLQVQNLFFAIDGIINYKVEFLSRTLIKITIVTLKPVSHDEIKEKFQRLFELTSIPIIKNAPFILPESSGKFICVKTKKENNHV